MRIAVKPFQSSIGFFVAIIAPLLFLASCTGVTEQRREIATPTPRWPTPLPVVSDRFSRDVKSIGQVQSPGILYSPMPYHTIWLLDPESGEQSSILNTEETFEGLRWSPDYSHFLYLTGSGATIVSFESGHSIRFADKVTITYAKWATSTLIYYCVFESMEPDGETALEPCFIYDIDTGETFQLTSRKRWVDEWVAVYSYQVSPGCKHVAFTAKGDSNYYLGNMVTGIVEPIYEMAFEFPYEGAIFGSWSPDGRQLAFSVSRCCIDGEYQSALYVIDANGENLRMILDFNAAYPQQRISQPFNLKWSPNGRWLSFFLRKDEVGTFHLVRPTGEKLQDLGIDADSSIHAWSADSQRLLISRKIPGPHLQYDLFIANINNGEETRITDDGYYKDLFDW